MVRKNYGFYAFIPLFIFLTIYIMGMILVPKQFPRHVAIIIAIITGLLMNRDETLSDKIDIFLKGAGNKNVILIVLIYLLAGGFQNLTKSMGAVDSLVSLALTFIPISFLMPGIFIITSIISTSIGTSMGTIAAIAPIAIGIAQVANLNLSVVASAIIGGAYFGDNLSVISDTTIAAATGVGSTMKDKFKTNFILAFPAAIIAIIFYFFKGSISSQTITYNTYDIVKIFPYIMVFILAIKGINIILSLSSGVILAFLIGYSKDFSILELTQGLGNGMSNMFSISIFAILMSGLIALIEYHGGIEWIVSIISKKINKKEDAEYGVSFLAGILSAALINNTIAIIISAPIAKEFSEKYDIEPRRTASLIDIFACAFLALVPYDGGLLILSSIAEISPLEVIKHSYYIYGLLAITILSIKFNFSFLKKKVYL